MNSYNALGNNTIVVIDNFFSPKNLKLVTEEVKKMQFWTTHDHPEAFDIKTTDKDGNKITYEHGYRLQNDNQGYNWYPGMRTNKFQIAHSLLDSFIIRHIERTEAIFTQKPWTQHQYAHLRTKDDNKGDFVHQDPDDWAYLIYLSDTNLDSGTKMYDSIKTAAGTNVRPTKEDKEHTFVSFVQNRIVMFDSLIPHMAWKNHGNDLSDGRLTINGFCNYDY